jgi:membrane protease YdiL (CAAX protease family)
VEARGPTPRAGAVPAAVPAHARQLTDPAASAPPPSGGDGGRRAAVPWGAGAAVGAWFVAFIAGQIGGGVVIAATGHEVGGPDPPLGVQLLAQLPLWAAFIGIPLLVAVRAGGGPTALGLRARAVDLFGVLGGFGLQLALVPIYIPILELFDVDPDRVDDAARELIDRAEGVGGAALIVLIAVVGAPIAEEIFYRGFMQPGLATRLPAWAAIGLTSLVFAGSHFQLLPLPGLVTFGVVAGVVAHRSGRLGPAIALHVGFNATTTVILLAS